MRLTTVVPRASRNALFLSVAFLAGYGSPVANHAQAAAFSYSVELAVPSDYRGLLEKNLQLMRWRDNPRMDAGQLKRMLPRAREDVRELMASAGYYAPEVDITLEGSAGAPTVRIRVMPGAPVRVAGVNLEFQGAILDQPAGQAPAVSTLREAWLLKPGEVFRHAAWEEAKRAVLRQLLVERFPGARIVSSRATVDPATRSAELHVTLDSGSVHRFGTLRVSGLERYPRSIIDHLNPIAPGSEYRQAALFDLQSRLQDSGYFERVTVTAATEGAAPENVPVDVMVEEKKRRRMGLGIGVSTDSGVRAQVDYQDHNLLGDGLRLTGVIKADIKEQVASLDLALPVSADGTRDSFGGGYAHTDIQGEDTRTYRAGAKRSWAVGRVEHSLGLQYQNEERRLSTTLPERRYALVPTYGWTYRNVDSPVFPQRGQILRLQVGAAADALFSSQDFLRGYGKWVGFVPMGQGTTLILRAEAGTVLSDSRRGIPSDYLFRTGGDQSLRGYKYQSIGVPEGNATVGGKVLAVASVELVRWLTPTWGAAAFYDVGDAAANWKAFSARHGYGIGARWRSPVGPVNLDFAYGEAVRKWRIHFSLGLAF